MKKLLTMLALMLALVCLMTACGGKDNGEGNNPGSHTHSFGEWETVKEPSYTEKGQKKRSCSCGEVETQDIPMLVDSNEEKYNEALALLEEKDYEGAYALFKALGDYKDAKEHLARFVYAAVKVTYTEKAMDNDVYESVVDVLFNDNNLPVKILTADGDYTYTDDYTYDANGNLIKEVHTDFYGDTTTYDYTTDYTYNASGNLIKEVWANSYGDTTTRIYFYDINGILSKETYSDSDGDTTDYTYDANGNLIKAVYTDSYGDTTTRDYTYDASGNLIKEVYTDSYGDTTTYEYTYDASGNLTKEVYIDSDNYTTTTDYAYDASGNLIKEVCTDSDGNTYSATDYAYDASGNLTKKVYIDSANCTFTADYDYDENGNLIYSSFFENHNDEKYWRNSIDTVYSLVYLTQDFPKFYREFLEGVMNGFAGW